MEVIRQSDKASFEVANKLSDFIFSAISEEMGIVFSLAMLFVCLFSFAVILKNSLKEKDKFLIIDPQELFTPLMKIVDEKDEQFPEFDKIKDLITYLKARYWE